MLVKHDFFILFMSLQYLLLLKNFSQKLQLISCIPSLLWCKNHIMLWYRHWHTFIILPYMLQEKATANWANEGTTRMILFPNFFHLFKLDILIWGRKYKASNFVNSAMTPQINTYRNSRPYTSTIITSKLSSSKILTVASLQLSLLFYIRLLATDVRFYQSALVILLMVKSWSKYGLLSHRFWYSFCQ